MIRLRLFKTAGVFVGANRRVGCKYSLRFLWSRSYSCLQSFEFNLATSRCCFEDYTYVLGVEE